MGTEQTKGISEELSRGLRDTLLPKDVEDVAKETNYSLHYVTKILQRQRYNEDVIIALKTKARQRLLLNNEAISKD